MCNACSVSLSASFINLLLFTNTVGTLMMKNTMKGVMAGLIQAIRVNVRYTSPLTLKVGSEMVTQNRGYQNSTKSDTREVKRYNFFLVCCCIDCV